MLSVVILTHNHERSLARCLSALVPAAAEGIVRDVVIVDAGSGDATLAIADAAGCTIVEAGGADAARLSAGVKAARATWFLVLRADAIMPPGWEEEARLFVEAAETRHGGMMAGLYAEASAERGPSGWLRLGWSAARGVFGPPDEAPGLLLSRRLHAEAGGNSVRKIGRRRLRAMQSAVRIDGR